MYLNSVLLSFTFELYVWNLRRGTYCKSTILMAYISSINATYQENLLFHSLITIIIKFGKFGHYQDIDSQVDLSNNYNCNEIIQ